MSQAPVKKKHKNKRKRESGSNGILQETPGRVEILFLQGWKFHVNVTRSTFQNVQKL